MKSLAQLCKPRQSVFDHNRRDVVLDLTDLAENHIDPSEFFEENYFTVGMRHLLREAFRRFAGKSPQGIFVLSQAMGDGKTHNMITLGLLAKHPALRHAVMGDLYEPAADVEAAGFLGEGQAPCNSAILARPD